MNRKIRDLFSIISRQLGLEPYLDFIVTSSEVGAPKPNPPLFLLALERARINTPEAIYVSNQYSTDVRDTEGNPNHF